MVGAMVKAISKKKKGAMKTQGATRGPVSVELHEPRGPRGGAAGSTTRLGLAISTLPPLIRVPAHPACDPGLHGLSKRRVGRRLAADPLRPMPPGRCYFTLTPMSFRFAMTCC